MSALADEAESVQDAALSLLTELGSQYEREHEKDLKATMTYAPEHFGLGSSLSDEISSI
jgi:acyl-coenzyme A thioesterase PaaI-like protein